MHRLTGSPPCRSPPLNATRLVVAPPHPAETCVPLTDGAVGRAPAWDIAFLFLSRLGQDRQQFVFAAGGEAGRAWPVQALFAFPGQ